MTVLAIDSSSRQRCIAILCDRAGRILGPGATGGRISAEPLSRQLEVVLASPLIEAVVVALGPGSYTGVRAGMAAALGVAQARDIPLHGVGSLEVVAQGGPPSSPAGIAVAPAGRGAVYAAAFTRSGGELRLEPVRWIAALGMGAVAGTPVVSFDDVPVPGVMVLPHPAAALAAVVPKALGRTPMARIGLAAHHVMELEQAW